MLLHPPGGRFDAQWVTGFDQIGHAALNRLLKKAGWKEAVPAITV
jgi:hypothetical protein